MPEAAAFFYDETDVWKCRALRASVRDVSTRAFLFFILASTAAVRGEGTALDALKLLPKDAAKRLARIEAREGTPSPERWYLLVHDPAEQRGVREGALARADQRAFARSGRRGAQPTLKASSESQSARPSRARAGPAR